MFELSRRYISVAALFAIGCLAACANESSVPATTISAIAAPSPNAIGVTPSVGPDFAQNLDPNSNPQPTELAVTSALGESVRPSPTPTFPPFRRSTAFVPLDDPRFVPAEGWTELSDSSFVLGLDRNDERRAYPLQMMAYHHIVNDTVGGDPTLITY
jgi:hypothetical protein